MWRVRPSVLFRLLKQRRQAQCARVEELFQTYIFGRETKLFGIHQLHLRLPARSNHLVGFMKIQAERLLNDDVLPRRRGIERDRAMKIIGNT